MVVLRGAAVAAAAFVAMLLPACGGEVAAGEPCAYVDLWRTTTLDSGDVLECQPAGSSDRQVWTLVGHNTSTGSLVEVGWLFAVVGATALTIGGVGIVTARFGHRRPFRRLE